MPKLPLHPPVQVFARQSAALRLASLMVFSLLVAALLCMPVQAKQGDKDQPLYATADALRVDDANRVSVFTGNVVITKGSIVIKADRFEVRDGVDGAQIGIATSYAGRLSTFSQDRDVDNESIRGQATRIDYNSATERLALTGKAVMRRFRGDTMADETAGERIVYTSQDARFVVDGAVKTGSQSSGRVRAVLAPKPSTPAPSN
ncbi:lipopolysaccharide transport periplasmic protein LptA [Comamonadaceae bacterium M7527]|nr:lipopolysaccharide transport periplasmic protein LptA [Comamonadaceae bacterium M7527]